MRHVFILLTLASLNACFTGYGTMDMTGFMLPLGLEVEVEQPTSAVPTLRPHHQQSVVLATSAYSSLRGTVLSMQSHRTSPFTTSTTETEGIGCKDYTVLVTAYPLFYPQTLNFEIRCTDEVQTIEVQLERETT
jgi:hypothetical protein